MDVEIPNLYYNPEVPKGDEFGTLIEEGSFSHVFKHVSRDGRISAIKVFKKKKNRPNYDMSLFSHEVKMMKILDRHPNIVQILEQGIYKCNTLCILMEYCAEGDLHNFFKKYRNVDEIVKRSIVKQTAEGLEFIHGNNMIHNDIKMENILVCNYDDVTGIISVKIGDFGLASIGKTTESTSGTAAYMSPEYCTNTYRTSKSDIWAFGILVYIIFFNRHPLCDNTNLGLGTMQKILINYKNSSIFMLKNYSNHSKEHLISKMLVREYNRRFSATSVLKHYYISNLIY